VTTAWDPDVLGDPYEALTLALPPDDEGEVVATLVRRRPERPARCAVLYVPGSVDYFFQTHLADWWVEQGYAFYALDMRKSGRSLRDHQTPWFCHSVAEYTAELDAAVAQIRADGHDAVVVTGHSTGALVVALWAHSRRDRRGRAGEVDALVLSSPFLDFATPAAVRSVAVDVAAAVALRRPYAVVPGPEFGLYGRSIAATHHGEWKFDLRWKPLEPPPLRAGWLRAIRAAQRRVQAGLAVRCPVLVLCSAASVSPRSWNDAMLRADAVLDVEQVARWAPRIGPCVTVQRIEGGMHDLVLSAAPVREEVFAATGRWLRAYGPPRGGE